MDNTTVKIDAELLRRIKKLLRNVPHRILYTNVKQFVNIAILGLLEQELKKTSEEKARKKAREKGGEK